MLAQLLDTIYREKGGVVTRWARGHRTANGRPVYTWDWSPSSFG